jgi:broad specificity phosphatase PhoE
LLSNSNSLIEYFKNSKKVYFVRHAESVFNEALNNDIILDIKNPGLSNTGIIQAEGLYNKLSSIIDKVDIIYVSPMKRTLNTWRDSKLEHNNVIINSIFREYIIHTSDLLPHETDSIFESEEDLVNRCNKIISYIKNNKYNKFIIISHGNLIHGILKELNYNYNLKIKNTDVILANI